MKLVTALTDAELCEVISDGKAYLVGQPRDRAAYYRIVGRMSEVREEMNRRDALMPSQQRT